MELCNLSHFGKILSFLAFGDIITQCDFVDIGSTEMDVDEKD